LSIQNNYQKKTLKKEAAPCPVKIQEKEAHYLGTVKDFGKKGGKKRATVSPRGRGLERTQGGKRTSFLNRGRQAEIRKDKS